MGTTETTRQLVLLQTQEELSSSVAVRVPSTLADIHGLARTLCHFRTRDQAQMQRALRAIPYHLWNGAEVILARHIRIQYQAAYQTCDKAERRRLSGLSLLLDEESAHRAHA